MTDPTTRAEEGAIQKEALLTASAWLNAYGLAGVSRRDGAYPKVTTLAREFESFGRHVASAAESRAASAEAEVDRLKHRVEALTDALEPLWQRARALGADIVSDDDHVTVFMLDCRIAARAALKESTHV